MKKINPNSIFELIFNHVYVCCLFSVVNLVICYNQLSKTKLGPLSYLVKFSEILKSRSNSSLVTEFIFNFTEQNLSTVNKFEKPLGKTQLLGYTQF